MPKPNFVFFGTPDLATVTLDVLAQSGYLPSLIVTQPDRPQGRGMLVTPPPVKVWAEENSVPYLQPEKLDENFLQKLKIKNYEIFIVVAYGKILPRELLRIPKHGTLNVHPSMLPRLRGPSPVRSAILTDERQTGTSIIVLDEEMDHGPIVAQESIRESISMADENWPPLLPELEEALFKLGGKLLVDILPGYVKGEISPLPQDESKATYCKKIKKEDGLVDPEKDSGIELYKKYCAYYGWPGIYFMKNGKRIKITEARMENDPLDPARGKQFIIERITPEGKREITWKEFQKWE
jgi:methionyl-tRNA formyltransferase